LSRQKTPATRSLLKSHANFFRDTRRDEPPNSADRGNGQVGHELSRLLPHLGEVVVLDREQLDLSKPEHIRRVIRDTRPNLVVNAAAYTAVDRAEDEEAAARAVNAEAPGAMAEEAKRIGAALVHYSTDYVFDGSKTSPYEEDDPPKPISTARQNLRASKPFKIRESPT
jgi:dTDP-4-dehydrorhamnose reductase